MDIVNGQMRIHFTIGEFELRHADGEELFACIGREGLPLAVFGPTGDPKSVYMARICVGHQTLPGCILAAVQGQGLLGTRHVAILDEKSRPWALTGEVGDHVAVNDAVTLLQDPSFIQAVVYCRTNVVTIKGDRQPHTLQRLIAKGYANLDDRERAVMQARYEEHWTDGRRGESMLVA